MAALPFVVRAYQLDFLIFLLINVILVVSYRLVTLAGEWSLVHVVMMGVGAYASALAAKLLGFPFWLALPAAGIMSALVAFVLSFPLFRMKGFYFLIGSFAAGEAIRLTWNKFRDPFGGPKGIKLIPAPEAALPGMEPISLGGPLAYYFLTAVVMIVFAVTKFVQGAWIVVILIPTLVWLFFRIHHHYQEVRRRLSVSDLAGPLPPAPIIHLVLISHVHAAALRQVQFVRSLGFRWVAVHVATDEDKAAEVRRKWARFFPNDPLVVLPSPLRDLVGPIRRYVVRLRAEHPDAFIHVIMSQILMDNLVEQALHQNTTVIFKLALQDIPMVVVTDVAYPLHPKPPEPIVEAVPGAQNTAAPIDRGPPARTT